MTLSKRAEYHWPAIRAHVVYYGNISYSGAVPSYIKEFVAAGMLQEASGGNSKKTFRFGAEQ